MPQGHPVIAQAGGSARGKRFAAAHADTIVAGVKGTEGMRAYREAVHAAMREQGRGPDDCKVLFLISPIIGATEEEALALERRRAEQARDEVGLALAFFGKITSIDFGGMDWDTPVDRMDLHTNGHQQSLDEFRRFAGSRTLREAMASYATSGKSLRLVGAPGQVAAAMAEAMDAVGGDGFLISQPDTSRRTIAEVADGLVPALQRLGCVRDEYEHEMFRDNLLAF